MTEAGHTAEVRQLKALDGSIVRKMFMKVAHDQYQRQMIIILFSALRSDSFSGTICLI
jgi:hypothetical protein